MRAHRKHLPQEPLSSAINFPANELEAKAAAFVEDAERQLEADAIESTFASWNYESNITDHNQKISLDAAKKSGLLSKKLGKEAQAFDLAQVKDKAVGLMGLTKEVDLKLLHKCFDLDAFDNLLKANFMDAVRARRALITAQ